MPIKAVVCGVLAVVATVSIMTAEKPEFAYDAKGRAKHLGVKDGDTMMPTWLLAGAVGLGVYVMEII